MKLKQYGNVVSIEPEVAPAGNDDPNLFPFDSTYHWNIENYGPVWVPKKGITIPINMHNICFYDRIIGVFENNDLQIRDGKIFINGKESTQYTFKMNYFWMMGDNRHNSADSRYWGFIDDHIVGKAVFDGLRLDPTNRCSMEKSGGVKVTESEQENLSVQTQKPITTKKNTGHLQYSIGHRPFRQQQRNMRKAF